MGVNAWGHSVARTASTHVFDGVGLSLQEAAWHITDQPSPISRRLRLQFGLLPGYI